MAESREAHVVEISAEGADHQQQQQALCSSAMQHHPLTEISQSPGHLLLLKLWQREEDVLTRRIGAKETRLDTTKSEAFQLCCLFFAFHGLFLTLLFTASLGYSEQQACKKWLIPSLLSLLTSLALVCSVQVKVCAYWRVSKQLQRERVDGRALVRCMQELRMKGASFDLTKEPQASKRRMKSSSAEISWRPIRWCSQNVVTICLVCFTGMLFPAIKFILCG